MDNLTIVIPYFNEYQSLNALLGDLPTSIPIIIVDDVSDTPLELYRPNTTVYRMEHKGYFTGAVNYGIQRCETDVLVLNQDIRLEGTKWLDILADNRATYALIGERIKGSHPTFPNGYVHGVFQYMRRSALDAVGIMDAVNYPLWGASALWQLQVCRKGFHSLPLPDITGLTHNRGFGNSFGSSIITLLERESEKKDLFIRTPPAISVIVPCYNYGRYLEDCIRSLIGGKTSLGYMKGQTFQSFEIIIVDDGSTDNTREIAESFIDGWNGIRYIYKKNGGTPSANNAGMKVARGKYLTHTSSDDMREEWSLQDLYQAAIHNPNHVIYDDLVEFRLGQRGRVWPLANYDFDNLLERNMMHAGIFFPKQAWVAAGGYPEAMKYGREDWAFNVALGQAGYCGLRIERSGYLYRREGQNRTLTNDGHEWRERFKAQMGILFPHLYRGERPMSCCGGNKPKASNNRGARMANILSQPSPEFTLVQYVGKNVGSTNYGGPGAAPSGTYYRFGRNARDRIKYVNKTDVDWLSSLRDNGTTLFALYTAPATEPQIEPLPEPQINILPEEDNRTVAVDTTGLVSVSGKLVATPIRKVIDPNNFTLDEIKEMRLEPEQWQNMVALEEKGKSRSSVLYWITKNARVTD